MNPATVTCPGCQASLRSKKALPTNRNIPCPKCGFLLVKAAPPPVPETPPAVLLDNKPGPLESLSRPVRSWQGLVAIVLLALGALIGGILWLIQPRTSPQSLPAPEVVVVNNELPRFEAERQQLETTRKELENKSKQLDLERQLSRGESALEKKQYEEAEKAFGEALKLDPHHGAAVKGVTAARTARTLTEQQQVEKEQIRTEYAEAMKQGQAALGEKQFALAIQSFERALQRLPGDSAANEGLSNAKTGLASDEDQKKKLAEYQQQMQVGKTALIQSRNDEAQKAFTLACELLPGEPEAALGLKMARDRLAAQAELDKKRAAFVPLMDQARAALQNRKYEEALDALQAAQRFFPQDPTLLGWMREAEKGRNQARAEYLKNVTAANQAIQIGRLEEAHRLFAEALRHLPGDRVALEGQQKCEKALQAIQATQAAYLRFMAQGSLAFQTRRYQEAIVNFQEALRIVPTDPEAARGLRDAQINLQAELQRAREFDRLLRGGLAALQSRNLAEAQRLLGDAQRLWPDHPQLIQAGRQLRYVQAMQEGQQAMNTQRYADAIRLFQIALTENPGDPVAANNLQRAQMLLARPGPALPIGARF